MELHQFPRGIKRGEGIDLVSALDELLEKLYKELDTRLVPQPKALKHIPHRIKWKGQFIRTSSGKTVWKKIGDAKSAFRLEIENDVYRILKKGLGRYPSHEEKEAFIHLIFTSGHLEFVPWEYQHE